MNEDTLMNTDVALEFSRKDTGDASRRTLSLREAWVKALVPVYVLLILSSPALGVAAIFETLPASGIGYFLAWAIAPPIALIVYVFCCACLSLPFRYAIVPGRFPRNLGNPVYGPRRLYALCWTCLYYCGPAYHIVLAIPMLKRAIFRLFGYRGDLGVQIYPDTWLRDLPLLDLGRGAYLSNKATIGTNMCLMGGDVLVGRIRVGDGAMVGHLAMIGPGTAIGHYVEVGVGAAIGCRVQIGENVRIGGRAMINHGARIGKGAEIGVGAYIGTRASIGSDVRIPIGAVIPDRARVRVQADLTQFLSDRLLRVDDAGVTAVTRQ